MVHRQDCLCLSETALISLSNQHAILLKNACTSIEAVLPLAFLLNHTWLMVNLPRWIAITNFDEKHCHKWALLLRERQGKIQKASAAINAGDFENARQVVSEVFYGVSAGKQAD